MTGLILAGLLFLSGQNIRALARQPYPLQRNVGSGTLPETLASNLNVSSCPGTYNDTYLFRIDVLNVSRLRLEQFERD